MRKTNIRKSNYSKPYNVGSGFIIDFPDGYERREQEFPTEEEAQEFLDVIREMEELL